MRLGPADATPLLDSGGAECNELPVASAAQDLPPRPVLDLPAVKERTTFQLWRAFVLCLFAVFPPLFTMSLFTEQLAAANSNFNYVRQYVTPFFFSIFLTSFVEVVCREFLSGMFVHAGDRLIVSSAWWGKLIHIFDILLFMLHRELNCCDCLYCSSAVAARLRCAVGFSVVPVARPGHRHFGVHHIRHCRRSIRLFELV